MTYYLTADLTFGFANGEATDEDFDAFVDRVVDELDNLQECDPGIIDPDVVGSLTERSLSILMGINADSLNDATRLFSASLRAALHAAECQTSRWPRFFPTEDQPQVRHVDATAV